MVVQRSSAGSSVAAGAAFASNLLLASQVGGWTLLTAVNLMLFSLLHNPCSTTILTIWNETRNKKWTLVATLLPLALAFGVTFITATAARLLGWA